MASTSRTAVRRRTSRRLKDKEPSELLLSGSSGSGAESQSEDESIEEERSEPLRRRSVRIQQRERKNEQSPKKEFKKRATVKRKRGRSAQKPASPKKASKGKTAAATRTRGRGQKKSTTTVASNISRTATRRKRQPHGHRKDAAADSESDEESSEKVVVSSDIAEATAIDDESNVTDDCGDVEMAHDTMADGKKVATATDTKKSPKSKKASKVSYVTSSPKRRSPRRKKSAVDASAVVVHSSDTEIDTASVNAANTSLSVKSSVTGSSKSKTGVTLAEYWRIEWPPKTEETRNFFDNFVAVDVRHCNEKSADESKKKKKKGSVSSDNSDATSRSYRRHVDLLTLVCLKVWELQSRQLALHNPVNTTSAAEVLSALLQMYDLELDTYRRSVLRQPWMSLSNVSAAISRAEDLKLMRTRHDPVEKISYHVLKPRAQRLLQVSLFEDRPLARLCFECEKGIGYAVDTRTTAKPGTKVKTAAVAVSSSGLAAVSGSVAPLRKARVKKLSAAVLRKGLKRRGRRSNAEIDGDIMKRAFWIGRSMTIQWDGNREAYAATVAGVYGYDNDSGLTDRQKYSRQIAGKRWSDVVLRYGDSSIEIIDSSKHCWQWIRDDSLVPAKKATLQQLSDAYAAVGAKQSAAKVLAQLRRQREADEQLKREQMKREALQPKVEETTEDVFAMDSVVKEDTTGEHVLVDDQLLKFEPLPVAEENEEEMAGEMQRETEEQLEKGETQQSQKTEEAEDVAMEAVPKGTEELLLVADQFQGFEPLPVAEKIEEKTGELPQETECENAQTEILAVIGEKEEVKETDIVEAKQLADACEVEEDTAEVTAIKNEDNAVKNEDAAADAGVGDVVAEEIDTGEENAAETGVVETEDVIPTLPSAISETSAVLTEDSAADKSTCVGLNESATVADVVVSDDTIVADASGVDVNALKPLTIQSEESGEKTADGSAVVETKAETSAISVQRSGSGLKRTKSEAAADDVADDAQIEDNGEREFDATGIPQTKKARTEL